MPATDTPSSAQARTAPQTVSHCFVPPFELVFLDLDGTALRSDLSVSLRTSKTLHQVATAGVHVVLASGRPAPSVAQCSTALPGQQFMVASNGGVVVNMAGGRPLVAKPFPQAALGGIERLVEALPVRMCLYTAWDWFVTEIDEWVELEARRAGIQPKVISSLSHPPALPAIKVMLIGEPSILRGVSALLRRELGGVLYWFHSYPEYLEIMPVGVSKGTACQMIRERLGIAFERVLAIGDGVNDVAMLDEAGTGVAVANAVRELLDRADYLAPGNDADGAAIALGGLVLGEPDALAALERTPMPSREP